MITNRIYEWARSQPTKPAFIINDITFSYAKFARAIEVTRSFIERQGLPVGQTAIVLPQRLDDAWVFVMALRTLGLNTVCVPTIALAEALRLRNVACIVVPDAKQEAPKLNGTPLAGTKVIIVPISQFRITGDPPLHPEQAPPFGGHIILTSGTTGTYKKVFLDGNYEDKRNAARALAYQLHKKPIYHVCNFGQWTTQGFRMPSAVWHTGGCVVMDQRRDAFNNFFHYAIDFSILTPPMLKELIHSSYHGEAHNNCELLVTAGFLPIELAEETARRLTKKVGITYGSTELATPAMLSRLDVQDDIYWLALAPDRTIRIVDENGDECVTGQEGELRIRLMDIDCASYLDDEETSASVFRDGFFCPGDMAVRRADGCVRILGRTADVLNVQGRKIAVAPIELEIQRALRVDEVCLFSGLSDAGKDELVVVIQSDGELPRSVRDQIARKFPSFEQVRFAFFKEFPRTTTGTRKTRRSILRKLVFPEHKVTS
jgi:acyl-coenzyme A synthetase/AMP-(fatty) acid ligase